MSRIKPQRRGVLAVRRRSRRGGLLFEMVLACGLLSLVIATVAQLSVMFVRQQRRASLHEYAAREASNLLEAASAVPYEELSSENLQRMPKLSATAARDLNAKVQWRISDATDEVSVAGRRVEVVVQWRTGELDKTTSLAAWRFPTSSPETKDDQP